MTSPTEENRLATAAETQVNRLIRAKAAPKWLPQVLAVIVTLLLIGGVVLGITVKKTMDGQNAQRQGAIASCVSGNRARATNVKIWDGFLSLLLTNPEQVKKRTDLTQVIAALHLPAADAQAFTALIAALYQTDQGSTTIVKSFEAYIAQNEKQQDCQRVYSMSLSAS